MTTDRKAGHTAGPWQIEEPMNGYVQIVGGIDGDANDDGTLRVIYTHVCDVIDNDDEQANAHLIAAAPDLLAALTHLTAVMGMHNKTPEEHLALTQAVRVIQSARGETAAQPKP